MTEPNQIYKCNVCANILEVLHAGAGKLVCCGQPMELMAEKVQDEGMEKHVPVVKKTATSVKVKIGAKKHPMEENHCIGWVEIIADGVAYKQFLKPGDKPKAVFKIKAENVTTRAYCNVHGLWKTECFKFRRGFLMGLYMCRLEYILKHINKLILVSAYY